MEGAKRTLKEVLSKGFVIRPRGATRMVFGAAKELVARRKCALDWGEVATF